MPKFIHHVRTATVPEHLLCDAEMLEELKARHSEEGVPPKFPGWAGSAQWMGMPVYLDTCPCDVGEFHFDGF